MSWSEYLFAAWTWLTALPPIILSGVSGATIAAVISILGVRAANQSSARRLSLQLAHDKEEAAAQRQHDSTQKDEDRKAAFRREAYIKAVEEVHAVLAYIGGLPEKRLSDGNDAEGLQAFLKANAKVWLVAESTAAHLSRNLASLVAELFFKARAVAQPFREGMEPIRLLDTSIEVAEVAVHRAKLAMDTNEYGLTGDATHAAYEEWLAANERTEILRLQRHRLVEKLAPARIACFKEIAAEMAAVQRAIVRLVSALRAELHLAPDEAIFMAQLEDMERRANAVVNRAYGLGSE